MENNEKVTTLTADDRESILRMISWENRTEGRLADMLLDAAKGRKANLWTIANVIEKLDKRDQELIDKVEVYLDERHNFMKNAEDEKEAANF